MAVAGWCIVALVLHVALFADTRIQDGGGLFPTSAAEWAGPWAQYDSWEYITIAERGYVAQGDERTRAVWFPGYAASILIVGILVHPSTAAAVVAAAIAGIAAVVLFARWAYWFSDRRALPITIAVALLYPYAWFLYGGAYSTPQFVALAIASFLCLESGRTKVGGLLGAAAMATHPMGFALLVGLVAREAERNGALVTRIPAEGHPRRLGLPFAIDRSKARSVRPIVLTPILGLFGYMAFLQVTVGDPSLWLTARSEHNSGFVRDTAKVDFVVRMVTWSDPQRLMTTVIQAAFVGLVIWWIPAIGRRFGWGYGIYVAALVAMVILGTADFNGSGRYLLAAFPVAAYAGERLRGRPRLTTAYLAASAVLLLGLTLLFGRTWYLT